MDIRKETNMKTSELIALLNESLKQNGDLEVVGIAMGEIYPYIDINCPDEDSPLYLELERKTKWIKQRKEMKQIKYCVEMI